MTRRILINGRRAEEVRVAIVENQTLEDYEIETKSSGLLRNNIYRGVVSNIAPSLNAAFVDFGDQKNGFLAFNDVVESVYAKPGVNSYKISDVLVPGQKLIVQVIKDATGMKGAQVTTNISLAGRYLVLRPKDSKSGVSHKIDEEARADLTQKVRSLDLPDGYGCIVRTNAMDQPRAMLLKDAKALVQLWHKIENESSKGTAPQLLYNDQDIVVSVMRDYFDSTINEVIIDDKSCFERARTYVSATMPNGEEKLRFYEERLPLFTRFGIEKQIEQIYARTVRLPSGGFIVIDPTEALTAIDVNSAHASKRETQDLTAYHTNLEAAVEIGRQLRMRDIGGLIVVDFIDMRSGRHQRDVERVMRNAMARDKARNRVERISANGLLEINRQRISQALSQRNHLECPTCGGRGFIPSAEAIAMSLIREIDARAANGDLGGVRIKLHPDIAQQLQNERRREFAQIENEYDICIEIVGSREMSRGDESIEWLTSQQTNAMRPERHMNAESSATSIIDVAEVYQNQQGCDEIYRPNDFEEFSSEEARRKRASRRALKQVNAANAAAADPVPAEAEPVMHETSIAYGSANFAMLAALIERIPTHMSDREEDNGRRRHKFAPRRRNRRPESSVSSDLRMFAFDILKSVCVVALGAQPMISKRDMMAQLDEAASWLYETSQLDEATQEDRYARMRNAIPSRHATMRLAYLYGEKKEQPDEVASLLCGLRDEATAESSCGIEFLRRRFDALLPQIFAPSAVLQGKEDATEAKEATAAPRQSQDKRANLPIAPKHIRHHHRATIEEAEETQVVADEVSGVDEATVVADEASVQPMMTEEAGEQISRRSVRRSRRTSRPAAENTAPDVASETAVEETQAVREVRAEESAGSVERRARRDRKTRMAMENTTPDVASETAVEETQAVREVRAEESAGSVERRARRDRKTARAAIGEDAQKASSPVVEMMPIVTGDVEAKAMTQEEEAREMAQTTHRSVRRSRRTSRAMTNGDAVAPNASEESRAVAEVKVEAQQTTDGVKSEESAPSVEKRTRRDRRTTRASMEYGAGNSKADEVLEEISKSEQKAADLSPIETTTVVTSDVEIKPMTPEVTQTQAADEKAQTTHRSVRRSRRTSRMTAAYEAVETNAAEAQPVSDEIRDEAQPASNENRDEAQPASDENRDEAQPASNEIRDEAQPVSDEIRAEESAPSVEKRARRDRRTSRASIGIGTENSKAEKQTEEFSKPAQEMAEYSSMEAMPVVTSDVEIKPMTNEATPLQEADQAEQTLHRSVRRSRRTSRMTTPPDTVESKATDVKAEAHKATDVKAEAHKATDVKAEAHKATDVKAEAHKATDVKAEAHKAADVKAEAHKAADVKAEAHKAADVKAEAHKATDVKAEAHKAEESAPSEEKRERRERKTMKMGSEVTRASAEGTEEAPSASNTAPRERAVRRTRRTTAHREAEASVPVQSPDTAHDTSLRATTSPQLAATPSSATTTAGVTEPQKAISPAIKQPTFEASNAVDEEGGATSRAAVESSEVQTRSVRRTRARRMATENASEGKEEAKVQRKERSTSAVQAMAEAVYEHHAQPQGDDREPVDIILKQPEPRRSGAQQEARDSERRRAPRRTRPHLKPDNT